MKQSLNILLYILGGAIALWLTAKILLPVGFPFLIGWALARLSRPLRPKKLPKKLGAMFGVTAVFLLLCLLFWLSGHFLFRQMEKISYHLPSFLESLGGPVQELNAIFLRLAARLPDSFAPAAVEWVEKLFAGSSGLLSSLSQWVLGWAANLLAFVPNLLLFILTALLSSYFFAIEEEKISALLHRRLPKDWCSKGRELWSHLKSSLKGYGKAQLYLSGISLLLCFVGLWILGKPPLWAVPISLVDALPVFGAGAVLIPWAVVLLLQGSSFAGVGMLTLYAIISISRTLLEPRFLGRQIGLHPLLTLLSLYAGFRFFGFWGILLLPVGVMMLKQLYDLSFG